MSTHDAVINREASFVDFSCLDRRRQSAVGFPVVVAVAKTTLAEVGPKLAESVFDVLPVKVAETEFLQAWGVDQFTFGIEMVEGGVRGRVLAGIKCLRYFTGGRIGFRHQGVDQGRFTHAGLAYQHAGDTGERGPQVFGVFERRKFEDAIAEAGKDSKLFARRGYFVGQVAFVEDDEDFDLFAFGGDQGAGDQLVGKGGFGGDDDDQLVDVGGNQFLFDFVGAVEQAGARLDGFDDAWSSEVRWMSTRSPQATSLFLPRGKQGRISPSASSTTYWRPWAATTRPSISL